jgi:hemoglobin
MRSITAFAVSICFVLGTSQGFAKTKKTTDTTEKPLAERLGGYKNIGVVVHDFVGFVGKDARINTFFANTDLKHLEKELTDQICTAGGGWTDTKHKTKCTYSGKDMKTAHAGLKNKEGQTITGDHFSALVEDLVQALDKHHVPTKEKNELLGALGPMKGDIVATDMTATATKTN